MHDFNGLKISRKVIASSALKYGNGYDFTENPISWLCVKSGLVNIDDFGAIITKTITVPEWAGNYRKLTPWKVIRIHRDKIYNRFAWHNCGIKKLIRAELPKLGSKIKKIIISIGALESIDEFFVMLHLLNNVDIAGIELNISCHNINLKFLENKRTLTFLFYAAREISRHPLIVKINAESDYIPICKIAQAEGINVIHVMNTMKAYSEAFGAECGRSGKENKEVALRIIRELRENKIDLPIAGGSWIQTEKDIIDYEKAGANIFVISSLFFYNPFKPGMIAKTVK